VTLQIILRDYLSAILRGCAKVPGGRTGFLLRAALAQLDQSQIVQLECLRSGIWGTKSLMGPDPHIQRLSGPGYPDSNIFKGGDKIADRVMFLAGQD
jgi:hypothetical protein